ncbi:MAG: hypothetical protein AAF915_01950 [Cyanobacteria bacterium P01_D01_bin.50]
MGKRGGHLPGSSPFTNTWRNGKTKTIRVPINLAPQIIEIARLLDVGINPIESVIIEFEFLKQNQYRRIKRPFNRSTPRWAVFNEFQSWLKNHLSK